MKRITLLPLLLLVLAGRSAVFCQSMEENYTLIIDSTNIYPDIDKILAMKEFKDKVVYVDIWGTRCSPCLEEFQYAMTLKKQFIDKPVAFLYLCSPYSVERDTKNEALWKDLIYKNQLTGIHIFMSVECYTTGFFEKYKNEYSESRQYGIPTYLLVGKHGEIRNFDATRPSDTKALCDDINELLAEK